jgi:hypothetical protein
MRKKRNYKTKKTLKPRRREHSSAAKRASAVDKRGATCIMSLSPSFIGKLFLFTGMEFPLGPLKREAHVNCPLNKAQVGPILIPRFMPRFEVGILPAPEDLKR